MQLHVVRVNKCNCATNVTPSYVLLLPTAPHFMNTQMAIRFTAALSLISYKVLLLPLEIILHMQICLYLYG